MGSNFLSELGLNAVVTRLKRASDAMLQDGKRMYAELGMDIEPNWFAVFKLLEKYRRLNVTEIAEHIGMSHPSMISIINKMISAGYLKESRSKGDSRQRILSLTAKSKRKIPEFQKVWDAATAGFKRMMHDRDILGMLDDLESRIAEKGFRERTLEQLEKKSLVEVVEFADKYTEDFARLNYEWIAKYYTVEEHDNDQLDNPRNIIDRGGQIFFAVVDGEVAGTVAMIRMNYEAFELAKMAVSPEFQGYKIGERLMQACVDLARNEGTPYIVLESNTKQFAAIHLYRKFGFVETPLDPNSQFSRANIRMELAVNELNM
ncbi:MAG: bifunctional helix-turn-helix transcriptional regulator/GNAT family N-acetyltransferase [Pyrinomonadaceae bacterium]